MMRNDARSQLHYRARALPHNFQEFEGDEDDDEDGDDDDEEGDDDEEEDEEGGGGGGGGGGERPAKRAKKAAAAADDGAEGREGARARGECSERYAQPRGPPRARLVPSLIIPAPCPARPRADDDEDDDEGGGGGDDDDAPLVAITDDLDGLDKGAIVGGLDKPRLTRAQMAAAAKAEEAARRKAAPPVTRAAPEGGESEGEAVVDEF